MTKTLRQFAAVIRITLGGLPQRWLPTVSAIASIALVVVVLLAFLAMSKGFERTNTIGGRDDRVVLLRAGSQSEVGSTIQGDQVRLLQDAPGIARDAKGDALVSPEVYVVVDGVKRDTGLRANLPLRGVGPIAAETRSGFRLAEGRMFRPGSREFVVGSALAREFDGLDVGSRVPMAGDEWTVVGHFTLDNPVVESEIWADIDTVQALFKRQNVVQSVRLQLTDAAAFSPFVEYNDGDPRLQLRAQRETEFFAAQTASSTDLIREFGWPLAIIMAVGALAGALNTMYTAVDARMREVATLRCLGFSSLSAFLGTMAESLVIALTGAVAGLAIAWLAFDGLTASTLGGNFTQVVFDFTVTPGIAVQGILLALVIGLVGGLFPAVRTARIGIREGLAG